MELFAIKIWKKIQEDFSSPSRKFRTRAAYLLSVNPSLYYKRIITRIKKNHLEELRIAVGKIPFNFDIFFSDKKVFSNAKNLYIFEVVKEDVIKYYCRRVNTESDLSDCMQICKAYNVDLDEYGYMYDIPEFITPVRVQMKTPKIISRFLKSFYTESFRNFESISEVKKIIEFRVQIFVNFCIILKKIKIIVPKFLRKHIYLFSL